MQLNPLTLRKLKRFKEIKLGYYSAITLVVLVVFSLLAELVINDRALFISYNGEWHFPTYSDVELGANYGLTGTEAVTPVNYRKLAEQFADTENTVIMPLIPWGPYTNDTSEGVLKAQGPDFERKHYLGTDTTGRDVLARLVYGFRTAIFFAIAFTVSHRSEHRLRYGLFWRHI